LNGETEKYLKKSYYYRKNGWIFLYIEGVPYERGFQHGYHLARELSRIIKTFKYVTFQNTGKDIAFFAEAAKKMFVPHIDSEFLEEMHGITDGAVAGGCEITFDELVAWNGNMELLNYWWPNASKKSQNERKNKVEHCSAFIATGDATKNNEIIMGHNSWSDFITGQFFNVILDIVPSVGHRIFMQTAPGFIHSCTDFFVTGAGIIGTETTIKGFDKFKEDEAPEFYRVRKAMQYGNNIDNWIEIMQQNNNGGYANSWLLGDINTNEIAQFEQGLEYSSIKKLRNGYFSGFNSPEDPQIRNLECTYTGYDDVRSTAARRVRWKQLLDSNYGQIDALKGGLLLEDHYDIYLEKKDNPSSRTICGHSDVDPSEFVGITGTEPYNPRGCLDAKVVSSSLAQNFAFYARFGRSCGEPFIAEEFLKKHPQWDWQRGYLMDRPTQPWTLFKAKI